MARTIAILITLIALLADSNAAEPPIPGNELLSVQAVEPVPAVVIPMAESGPIFYGRKDFLIWWYNTPNNSPLLTTGDPINDPQAGILGGPTTRTLYGGRDIDMGAFYGARLTFGLWDPTQSFGLEAGAFALGRQNSTFSAGADGTGNPFLAVPFFSSGAGIENRLLVANSGGADNQVNNTIGLGSFTATFQSQLAGAELNAMANLAARPGFRMDFLGGFVWRGLYENLKLEYQLPETGGGRNFNEVGPPFNPTFGGSAFDQFSTRNNFYGGQIGARTTWDAGRFSFDFTGKLGIGATVQQVTIEGQSRFISTTGQLQGPPTVVEQGNPYGVFAQTSNIGRYTQTGFALIPELITQANFHATSRVKVFVGYNLMYWSNVVRPGDQIDRSINRTNPGETFHYFTGLQSDVPALAPRPAPTLKTTDLFVQGINLGFELQY